MRRVVRRRRRWRPPDGSSASSASPAARSPRARATSPARVRTPVTRRPGTSDASAALAAGTTALVDPGSSRRGDRRQHAAHRPDPAVQAQLAEQHRPVERPAAAPTSCAVRIAAAMAQVEARAALGQAGRREVDGDPLGGRPVLAAVDHRCPHPVPRLGQRRVRQPHQAVRRHADAEVGLDLDQVTLDAHQRHRHGCGPAALRPPPGRARPRPAPRAGRSTPTRSIRTSGGCTRRSRIHAAASRRSRAALRAVTASSGCPKPVDGPGLDLADDQHVAVPGDDVDLAERAAPVAVQDGHAPRLPGARPPPARRTRPTRPWPATRHLRTRCPACTSRLPSRAPTTGGRTGCCGRRARRSVLWTDATAWVTGNGAR